MAKYSQSKNVQNKGKVDDKKRPNILIVVLMIVLIIVIIIAVIYNVFGNKNSNSDIIDKVENDIEDIIVNGQEGVIEEKKQDGLVFNNTSLTSKDGETFLVTQVTNTTNEDYYLDSFHIFIRDKSGNDLISYIDENGETVNYLVGLVGNVIKPSESKDIITSVDLVLADDAYTVEYEIVK